MSPLFSGIVPSMLTPLDEEERLDRPSVKRLVDYILAGGVDGLFLLGSVGEGAGVRPSVRQQLVEAAVEAVNGRVPVIAGVLQPSTAAVIDEIRALADRGLDGYVATSPYYYGGFNDSELFDHFQRIAEAADRPLLLYSIPSATRIALSAPLVLRLANLPRVAGVKDSSGDWTTLRAVLRERSSREFTVLQGWTPHGRGQPAGRCRWTSSRRSKHLPSFAGGSPDRRSAG